MNEGVKSLSVKNEFLDDDFVWSCVFQRGELTLFDPHAFHYSGREPKVN